MNPTRHFEQVVERMLGERGVELRSAFHKPGLRVDGHIFAMLVGGRLVVKLPEARCRAIEEEGEGEPFSVGKRSMREWVSVPPSSADDWTALADEAREFVRG